MNIVASFQIEYRQFIDRDGHPVQDLPTFAKDALELTTLYRAMVLTRVFDEKAIALQRTGRMGTYPSCAGQEAIGVGIGRAMALDDVFVPSYREQGAQLMRGVRIREILLYWGGDERGSDFANAREDFPVSVPVGSHACHATGVAFAMRYRQQARAVVCVLGDGATSKGDFYESINVAGAWGLPVVFVVNNNQWAISVPRARQCAAETLAQKAVAAGIPGLQVDGNDVVAVRAAVEQALRQARNGGGATLIEALSYRLSDHTTADDARRYRPEEDVRNHRRDDPIERLSRYMRSIGIWDDERERNLGQECAAQVKMEVDAYLSTPMQPPQAMFDFLYQDLPRALQRQRDGALVEEDTRHG